MFMPILVTLMNMLFYVSYPEYALLFNALCLCLYNTNEYALSLSMHKIYDTICAQNLYRKKAIYP